jgi:phosphoglycerate dehydrogenase-like enzyme
VAGTVVVNSRSRLADGVLAMLEHLVPDERFVAVAPGDAVPADAEVLVTLLDDPSGIEELLAPQIRWVHILSAGIDGFPLEAAAGRQVTCSRGASAAAIAEWVMAVMLAFEKKLPESFINAPPPQFEMPSLGGLAGRTLGVMGLGAIGSAIVQRALAFDMTVVALRRTATPPPPQVQLAPTLHALVADADHVVLAAPATARTSRVFDADAFGACKAGVHFVNISRGTLVDHDALLVALDNGTVARASLDVVHPEPLPDGHPLYTHPRVRLSPHVSWSSHTSAMVTLQMCVDNLRRYRDGVDVVGVVDIDAGY